MFSHFLAALAYVITHCILKGFSSIRNTTLHMSKELYCFINNYNIKKLYKTRMYSDISHTPVRRENEKTISTNWRHFIFVIF